MGWLDGWLDASDQSAVELAPYRWNRNQRRRRASRVSTPLSSKSRPPPGPTTSSRTSRPERQLTFRGAAAPPQPNCDPSAWAPSSCPQPPSRTSSCRSSPPLRTGTPARGTHTPPISALLSAYPTYLADLYSACVRWALLGHPHVSSLSNHRRTMFSTG